MNIGFNCCVSCLTGEEERFHASQLDVGASFTQGQPMSKQKVTGIHGTTVGPCFGRINFYAQRSFSSWSESSFSEVLNTV